MNLGDKKIKKENKYTLNLKRFVGLSFFVLLIALFNLQVVRGDYFLRRARNNYMRAVLLPSLRGSIYDRNGTPLAEDKAAFNIAVIPYQVSKDRDFLFEEIAQYLELDKRVLHLNYRRNLKFFFSPTNIVTDIDKQVALELKRRYPESVLINPTPKRNYPLGLEFAHLLGYVKKASFLQDYSKKYGYTPRERIGVYGLEQYYDSYLKGQDGGDLLEVDARGNAVGFLGRKKPTRGKDIYLTIDNQIQKIARESLARKKGTIIFFDSNSGEVLAMYSSPSFDPNSFIEGRGVGKIYADRDSPLINRATQSTYPLGSVIKPIIALAGLEEEEIDSKTTFDCKGVFSLGRSDFRCSRIHGLQDLTAALGNSCNVYFYQLGLRLGVEKISRWAKKFGLDSKTKIDLPYQRQGVIPNPEWKRERFNQSWYAGDTVNLSIGQGYTQVTPLAIALAINAIAIEGYLVEPTLLKRIEDRQARPISKKNIKVDKANIAAVKEGMRYAVTQGTGTARALGNLGLDLAGKTGTAQTSKDPHGWFIGFFPYQKPQYTIAVFLENGGSGSEAVRTAHHFLSEIKKQNLLQLK